MSFETTIASRNSQTFFSEFTFSSGKFRSQTGQELELCDGAIWLDELLILFQLKERNAEHDSNAPDTEAKWFDKKVSKLAVDQFADTVKYLEMEKTLPLANLRGQTIDLRESDVPSPFKVALYLPSEHLPESKLFWKGRTSKRVGFVHFIHAHDYINFCDMLCTPYEVSDYLRFREQLVLTVPAANVVSEKALFGNYLSDADPNALCDMDELMVDAFVDDRAKFSISQMLSTFFESMVSENEGTLYHALLAEFAKLRRNTMKLLRDRLHWAMDRCKEETQEKPSRFLFA